MTNRRAYENLWIPPTYHRPRVCVSRSCLCLEKPGHLWTWSPEWTTPSRSAAPACTILRCGAAGVKVTTSSWTVRTVFSHHFQRQAGFSPDSCAPGSAIADVGAETKLAFLFWMLTRLFADWEMLNCANICAGLCSKEQLIWTSEHRSTCRNLVSDR